MDTSFVWQTIEMLIGWPLILFVVSASIICTLAFNFVQIRYFFKSWKMLFAPGDVDKSKGDISPFSAFVNTLNANLGNGSIVGGAVAVATGGPGAALWVLIIGLLLMAVRFAEVYASALYGARAPKGTVLGGPMLYLRDVFGGRILAPLYAIVCFIYSVLAANMIQSNSMSYSLGTTWGVNAYLFAVLITLFIGYVVLGGAQRIVAASDRIVPVKVVVFVIAATSLIVYHAGSLTDTFHLMYVSSFTPEAFVGGILGFSVMQAIQAGMNLVVTATESGLGTAAVLFGFTGSKNPMASGVISMISTLISSICCFTVALCTILSGVWNTGLTGPALTIAAFQTVFGTAGGWIVTFLSVSFGVGVLVAFAYIARATWFYLTGGKYEWLFALIYAGAAFTGAIIDVKLVWKLVAVGNGLMLFINIFGILCLVPTIRRHMISTKEGRG